MYIIYTYCILKTTPIVYYTIIHTHIRVVGVDRSPCWTAFLRYATEKTYETCVENVKYCITSTILSRRICVLYVYYYNTIYCVVFNSILNYWNTENVSNYGIIILHDAIIMMACVFELICQHLAIEYGRFAFNSSCKPLFTFYTLIVTYINLQFVSTYKLPSMFYETKIIAYFIETTSQSVGGSKRI